MTLCRMTRRHAGCFTVSVALALAFMFITTGQAHAQVEISVGSASGAPGAEVNVDLTMATNGEEPSTIVMTLVYDAQKLSFVDLEAGPVATDANKGVFRVDQPGLLGMVIFGGVSVMGDGRLLTITFRIAADVQSGASIPIAGDGEESASDPSAREIQVSVIPGAITVSGDPQPSKVATPTISPATTTGQASYQITLNTTTANATIRYTTDGSGPTLSSTEYTGSFTLSGTAGTQRTVRARAWRDGWTPSDVASRTYTFRSSSTSTGSQCGGLSKASIADVSVYEEAFPLSAATPDSELAVRVLSPEPIDPATVWARAEWEGWHEDGGAWRPTVFGDDSDGWVVFAPATPWPAGETVTLTVSALTVSGAEAGPITREFQIGSEKEAAAAWDPAIAVLADGTEVPELQADALSPAYRIGPDGVFDQPVPFWIPVPEGADLDSIELYYFSESTENWGWYLGENVIGWMVPGSRRLVEEDGQVYLELELNHAGIVRLADSQSVKVRADVGILLGFAVILGMKFTQRRKKS